MMAITLFYVIFTYLQLKFIGSPWHESIDRTELLALNVQVTFPSRQQPATRLMP